MTGVQTCALPICVGSIQLRPVEREGKIEHVRMISLSLTLNHQVIDGAPGARFLRELVKAIESFKEPQHKE